VSWVVLDFETSVTVAGVAMRSISRWVIACFLGFVLGGVARGGTIQLTSASQLAAGDSVITFPGSGTGASPVFGTVGSETAVFQGIAFTFYDVGTNYSGSGFANGTDILETKGVSSPENQMMITFETPVTEVGFYLEDSAPGAESYTINGYTVMGNDPSSLAFFGLEATPGTTISSIFIQDSRSTDFAIGPVTFGLTAPALTPEPGTLGLVATAALVGLGAVRRKEAKA
jgi:hypothetical protein